MRVLVTGGGGLLARYLVRPGEFNFDWIVTSRSEVDGEENVEVLDLTDVVALQRLLSKVRPEVVVNAAAEGSVDAVQASPEDFLALNVEVPSFLARHCRDQDIPFVHVSSNAVFGGDPAPYDDESPYRPVNAYGEMKRQAENEVLRTYPQASILRPIQMYGWPRSTRRANLASAWISRLRRKVPIQVVDDVVSEPLWAADAASAIRKLITQPLSGCVNISGGQAMTLFEFARLIANVFELDDGLITPASSESFTALAPRPRDTRFTLRRLRDELGISPLPPHLGLAVMRAEEMERRLRSLSV